MNLMHCCGPAVAAWLACFPAALAEEPPADAVPVEDVGAELPWSDAVVARAGTTQLATCQATLAGDWLIIQTRHKPGWHTYAIDNEQRALEALQGKQSLGVEEGMRIEVRGVELEGVWHQSKPGDFSKPELRWFSFGFDGTSWFARRIRSAPDDKPVLIRLQGQACSGTTCRRMNVTLKIAPSEREVSEEIRRAAEMLTGRLVPVREQATAEAQSESPSAEQS